MSWIPLVIEPESHQILVLAEETGETPERVFCAIVRWFKYVDKHYDGNATLSVTEDSFHRIARWSGRKSLAAACRHREVDWLEQTTDNRLRPTRPDSYFGRSAKQRHSDAKRSSAYRQRKQADRHACVTVERDGNRDLQNRTEQNRTRERQQQPPRARDDDAAVPDPPTDNPPDAVHDLIRAGFSFGQASKLACHPNAGAAYVRRVVEASRSPSILKPKGWIVAAIEAGDFETPRTAADVADQAAEKAKRVAALVAASKGARA